MKKLFERIFRLKKSGEAEGAAGDENFVILIQAAREDADLKKKLTAVLSFDDFNRQSALNTWINELSLRSAPKDFIKALSYLLDAEIARKALHLLLELGD